MTGLEELIVSVEGVSAQDVRRWVENDWVRPSLHSGAPQFEEIDIARIQLIVELRDELDINEAALPVVLHLLDQIYAHRRLLRDIGAALDHLATQELRDAMAQHVRQRP